MGRLLLLDVIGAVAILTAWYFWFSRYNRRKAAAVLRSIQLACAAKGRIIETTWRGNSLLHAKLHQPSRWFYEARLTVRLLPRPIPIRWLLERWHKQRETLTFEADLPGAPGFRLDVLHHRWCGHNSGKIGMKNRSWNISRPGPIVLTTREKWSPELNPVVNALLLSREKDFLNLRFRPHSPHFSATVDLDRLSNQNATETLLSVLAELAEGASAKQH